jgi:hypothetical protein
MGRRRSRVGFDRKAREKKIPLGRPRSRWVNNLKMDLREIDGDISWIDLAQDRDK